VEEDLHPISEQRVVTVILITMPNRNKRWAERTLAAFWYDDLFRAREIGGEAADHSKFEASGSSARFYESAFVGPNAVWNGGKGLFLAAGRLIERLVAESDSDQPVAVVACH
jgi:hypothetical protein